MSSYMNLLYYIKIISIDTENYLKKKRAIHLCFKKKNTLQEVKLVT